MKTSWIALAALGAYAISSQSKKKESSETRSNPKKKKILTDDDFSEKYTPDDSIESEAFKDEEGYEGMLETYGPDLKLAVKIANTEPRRIWTMIDGDTGMWLVAGYHLVNRIYYVVTKEEFEDEDEEYLIQKYDEETEDDES